MSVSKKAHHLQSAIDHDASREEAGRIERAANVELGQWYWVRNEKDGDWLGCVMQVGSNFVELRSVSLGRGRYSQRRVHLDNFYQELTLEPNAEAVINAKVSEHQSEAQSYMLEVQRITARLGVDKATALPGAAATPQSDSTGMAVLSGQGDVKSYENALMKAKEEDLPRLFKQIEEANTAMSNWMIAKTLPMQAVAGGMKGVIETIEDRVFNISIYAGLTETVEQVATGEPAPATEKLHLMQRRLYADEECLLGYRTGGMEFENLSEYDAWLCEPENRNRILPFPRCMVAMRVRRKEKERRNISSVFDGLINANKAMSDKYTYLYIRNGENVYRLNAHLEFDEMIFPDARDFDPTEPKMVRTFASKVDKMMGLNEYESLSAEYEERKRLSEQWYIDNPYEEWKSSRKKNESDSETVWRWDNPHSMDGFGFDPHEWRPFDPSNVYFDECAKEIETQIKKYNRIALIVQGLFDRSEVLHPHPPVRTWTPEGFNEAIELVYDASMVLHYGDAPDIQGYIDRCNETLGPDSITVGQEVCWERKEARKENARTETDWRLNSTGRHYETFRPYGNEGPGYLARMAKWQPRARKAVFTWMRERLRGDVWNEAPIRATVTVPAHKLFNVSAYQPGDYKQFFQDPRTRAEYLKWAPMLLAAEEYYAGNMSPQEPV